LQQKRFVLPQVMDGVQAHFCNESVYGKVNILWCCGVIRMAEGNEAANAANEFDAWPSAAAKSKIDAARAQIEMHARMAEQMYGYDF
jgi:hypothetical protein